MSGFRDGPHDSDGDRDDAHARDGWDERVMRARKEMGYSESSRLAPAPGGPDDALRVGPPTIGEGRSKVKEPDSAPGQYDYYVGLLMADGTEFEIHDEEIPTSWVKSDSMVWLSEVR